MSSSGDEIDDRVDEFLTVRGVEDWSTSPTLTIKLFALLSAIVFGLVEAVFNGVIGIVEGTRRAVVGLITWISSSAVTGVELLIPTNAPRAAFSAAGKQLSGPGILSYVLSVAVVGATMYVLAQGVTSLVGE